MKSNPLRAIAFMLLAACVAPAWSQDLGGTWDLKLENLQHKLITSATIRFTAKPAQSCMGGTWKRVVVESSRTSDASFFPVKEHLSYRVENSQLIIGRNEICDAYLQLDGALDKDGARGDYVSFGIGGSKNMGYFSVSPRR